MPEGEELSDQFSVRSDRREMVLLCLLSVGMLCGGLFGMVFPQREVPMGIFFTVIGAAVLVFCLFYCSIRYQVDRRAIIYRHWFLSRTVLWRDVTCAKLLEKDGEKDVTLALYSGNRLVMDCSSSMRNFWKIVKLAESLGLEIRREKYVSLRKMMHP